MLACIFFFACFLFDGLLSFSCHMFYFILILISIMYASWLVIYPCGKQGTEMNGENQKKYRKRNRGGYFISFHHQSVSHSFLVLSVSSSSSSFYFGHDDGWMDVSV